MMAATAAIEPVISPRRASSHRGRRTAVNADLTDLAQAQHLGGTRRRALEREQDQDLDLLRSTIQARRLEEIT
jgi:hypothetical protein